jgi:hypothetical protein
LCAELGGTWALRDPRHPEGSMTQAEICYFLTGRGYLVFIIVNNGLFQAPCDFYSRLNNVNTFPWEDGDGYFVQGNALAIHPQYAEPAILKVYRAGPHNQRGIDYCKSHLVLTRGLIDECHCCQAIDEFKIDY